MKKKLQYWFDNQMSKGPVFMGLMLAGVTFLVLLFVVILINIFEPNEDGVIFTIWDSLSSIINAWMPYSDEGGIGYLLPTAFAALFGLLFTSILIGIIGSSIEEKVNSLKKGNSIVAEKGHIVLLGYESGAYELINQLIQSAGKNKLCLVIAGEAEREEAEGEIRSNVTIPRNVKLIYRSADICDANSISCCSIESACTVVINSYDDFKSFKSVLAVIKLLRAYPEVKPNIVSSVNKDEYVLPISLSEKKNVLMIQTNDVIARIIAHSCAQPGISQTFLEVINFEGSEIHIDKFDEFVGKSFGELYQCVDKAVPLGFLRGEKAYLCPKQDEAMAEDDRLIYLSKERGEAIYSHSYETKIERKSLPEKKNANNVVAIFGFNEKVNTLIAELPGSVREIIVVNATAEGREVYESCLAKRPDCSVSFVDIAAFDHDILSDTVKNVDHVILLSDHEIEREQADIQNMMIYLKLLDIQIRINHHFNITAELFYENNRELITSKKTTDFVVANNMSSLLSAQIAVTPDLIYVFDELLSNSGVEIRILCPTESQCACKTILDLRRETYALGAVLIGYIGGSEGAKACEGIKACEGAMVTHLNPGLDEAVELGRGDLIIGIC